MSSDAEDFEDFMKRREEAGRAYANGDAAPLSGIVANDLPATFFSPKGGYIKGAKEVANRYRQDARSFDPGGDSTFEILQMAASNGIAYWTGFQRARAKLPGQTGLLQMTLRVTEVFRREGSDWKLVHRHADMLSEESSGNK